MANENKTAKEYVQKGYLIAHLANCGIRTINYDEWERLCECIHEAKPADVVDKKECSVCVFHPFKQLREQLETNMVEVVHEEWIPCSERLPQENGRYLVTRGLNACGSLWNRVYIVNYSDLMGLKKEKIWWDGNVGKSDFERIDDVIAWMPLPQPWGERREDGEIH